MKHYDLAVKPDTIKDKKLIYMNKRDKEISLDIISNMPNVVEVMTSELKLGPGGTPIFNNLEKSYIKIRIRAPATLCKLIVRIGILN